MEDFSSREKKDIVKVIVGVVLVLILLTGLVIWALVHTWQNNIVNLEVSDNLEIVQTNQKDDQINNVADNLIAAINTYYAINGFYPPDDHIEYLWSGNRTVIDIEPVLPEECGQINAMTNECGIKYMTVSDNQGFVLDVRYLDREAEIISQDEGINNSGGTSNQSGGSTNSEDTSPRLSISPIVYDSLSGYPGESLSLVENVYNHGSSEVVVKISVQDFIPRPGDASGVPELTTEKTQYSMADWISYDQDELTIQPGEAVDVDFAINIPSDAKVGGHYSSMIFEVNDDSGELSMKSGWGSLILLKVLGDDLVESGYVKSVTKSFGAGGWLKFIIEFVNDGNVHVYPSGRVSIFDLNGDLIDELELSGENVLPGSTRNIEIEWYRTSDMADFDGYLVELNGKYGEAGKEFSFLQQL